MQSQCAPHQAFWSGTEDQSSTHNGIFIRDNSNDNHIECDLELVRIDRFSSGRSSIVACNYCDIMHSMAGPAKLWDSTTCIRQKDSKQCQDLSRSLLRYLNSSESGHVGCPSSCLKSFARTPQQRHGPIFSLFHCAVVLSVSSYTQNLPCPVALQHPAR